ncbi:MAG: Maf family protein [Flavobacteriales bacterium]|nr:Maf family protein [Flavobacteriales bacterium]
MDLSKTVDMNILDEKINHLSIVLASKSPRRQELLKNIFSDFNIEVREIDETFPSSLKGGNIAQYISEQKAKAFTLEKRDDLIITADTIVCLENQVLGKPKSHQEAYDMLRSLSGKTHVVYTGVSLLFKGEITSFYDATHVSFYELSDDEINYYINKHQPFDKAGSYGIQEWMGYVGIQKMEGDFFNVMGLPLHRLYREVNKLID